MNIFDAEHPNDLGGIFSSIKKIVKKAVKLPIEVIKKTTKESIRATQSINHLRNKIDDKVQKATLGNTLNAKLDKFKDSKEFQAAKKIVATTVATVVTAPIGGVGGAIVAAGIAADDAKKQVRAEIKNADLQAQYDEQYAREIDEVLALSKDPDMQARIISMLEAGYTPQQIKDEWVRSNMFTGIATAAAVSTALPVVVDGLVNQGVPIYQAEQIGVDIATDLTNKEVAAAKGSNLLIPLALAALTFLG